MLLDKNERKPFVQQGPLEAQAIMGSVPFRHVSTSFALKIKNLGDKKREKTLRKLPI
jgi:hypothetical protein